MNITSRLKNEPTKTSKDLIISTIEDHPEGVLTTINPDGTPSNSVITLHELGGFDYFFMTKDTTKKYDNLEMNPNVSFMIFDSFSRTELEIKGLAEYIWDDHTRKKANKIIDKDGKHGPHHISPFVTKDDSYVLYAIHPQTIHFTTFWDQGEGPERYSVTLEFNVEDSGYAV